MRTGKADEILTVERERFLEFKRRAGRLIDKAPQTEWDSLVSVYIMG